MTRFLRGVKNLTSVVFLSRSLLLGRNKAMLRSNPVYAPSFPSIHKKHSSALARKKSNWPGQSLTLIWLDNINVNHNWTNRMWFCVSFFLFGAVSGVWPTLLSPVGTLTSREFDSPTFREGSPVEKKMGFETKMLTYGEPDDEVWKVLSITILSYYRS